MSLVSIIIPTFDNEVIFSHCLASLLSFTDHPHEILVVQNGGPYEVLKSKLPNLAVLTPGKNLGWIGGVNFAKNYAQGEYVLMLNDDTQIVDYDSGWLGRLVSVVKDEVAAAGPISNAMAWFQSIGRSGEIPHRRHTAPALSGCCLLVRKAVLDDVGWLDDKMRGGDDLDLSFRLRKKGYELAVCRDVFILHRYASTGRRVFGNYWDSQDHGDHVRIDMIRKHGLKEVLAFERSIQLCDVTPKQEVAVA